MAENGLEMLRQEALTCQRCGLAQRRKNVVFGEGNPHSPLVIIGEGPGDQEDESGRPFIGKSGLMLSRAFALAGLTREQIYITNTVKCRAATWQEGQTVDGQPVNSQAVNSQAVNRPPTPQETEACRHWLLPQLGFIAPKVLLCIGAASAKNLIRKNFKITQERGQAFPCEFAQIAIATLHPSYIMRMQRKDSDGGFSLLVDDLTFAWSLARV